MGLIFSSSSWILAALIVMSISMTICMLALWVVRNTVSAQTLKKNHDVAGFTFSIVGVLYSVILGFTVINVQNRYTEAQENMHIEAMTLASLYRDAVYFPKEGREEIRGALRDYVNYILKEEWLGVEQKHIHVETQKLMDQIWDRYYTLNPSGQKTVLWYEQSIKKLDDLMDARLKREFNSWEHLSQMMWTLLIVGAIVTICFMFFFGLENFRSHMLMMALLSGYLSFMLYLVFSLDNIFRGPEALQPIPFEQILELFNRWDF